VRQLELRCTDVEKDLPGVVWSLGKVGRDLRVNTCRNCNFAVQIEGYACDELVGVLSGLATTHEDADATLDLLLERIVGVLPTCSGDCLADTLMAMQTSNRIHGTLPETVGAVLATKADATSLPRLAGALLAMQVPGAPRGPAAEAILSAFESRAPMAKGPALANVLWALAKVGKLNATLVDRAERDTLASVAEMNGGDMTRLLWFTAAPGCHSRSLVRAIERRLPSRIKAGDCSAAESASILWSWAHMGMAPGPLTDAAEERLLLGLGDVPAGDLGLLLGVAATSDGLVSQPLLNTIQEHMVVRSKEFSAKTTMDALTALATLVAGGKAKMRCNEVRCSRSGSAAAARSMGSVAAVVSPLLFLSMLRS